MTDPRTQSPWHLVVPVKGGPQAKSRLTAPDGVDHASLATAFALDTVTAAAAAVGARHVLVVTSGAGITEQVAALGVRVLADPGSGLNPAISAGLADLHHVGCDGPTGVLLGDLPAVRVEELRQALDVAGHGGPSFVPDAVGTGTVLLTGPSPPQVEPHFGAGSASAHEQAGHGRLELDLPGLRTDVDDETSLRTVLCLGVGTHTARLLAHLITPPR